MLYDMETLIKDMDKGRIAKQGIPYRQCNGHYEFPIETAKGSYHLHDEIQKLLRNTATALCYWHSPSTNTEAAIKS